MRLNRKSNIPKKMVEDSAEVLDLAVEDLERVIPSKIVRGRVANVRKFLINPLKKKKYDN